MIRFSVALAAILLTFACRAETPVNTVFASGFDVAGCENPDGMQRLLHSDITYGAGVQPVRSNVDVTEWNNIWGHGTANANEPVAAWPGVNGAGPVIRGMSRTHYLAAHFNTGHAPIYLATLTDQSNTGGPYIDVVVSKTCGDFSPNPTYPGCSRYYLPSDGITHFNYFSNDYPAGHFSCKLELDTDYYVNIRFSDPSHDDTDCRLQSDVCPMFTINYWAPFHP
jgi:hypothetical protein